MTVITYRVAMEIAHHEALVRQAYLDSGGTWTWSVGLTAATGHDVRRYIGKPQTLDHCLRIFVWALERYAEAVRAEFTGHALSEAQFAAALSFHWNTGRIAAAKWTDLWMAGKVKEARDAFLSFNKPKAIIDRREAEARLFFDGEWSGDGRMPEYTRLTSRSTPVWKSRTMIDVKDVLRGLLSGSVAPAPEPPTDDRLTRAAPVLAALAANLADLTAILNPEP
jgi:GH24 family phage-related lysozyme (muramidase)